MIPDYKTARTILYSGIGALLLASCSHSSKDKMGEETPEITVAYPMVDSVTLSNTYPGTTIANATAKIVARVNGMLLSKNYTSGSEVTKGSVLFTIEPTQYRDAVKEAEAALATAKSEHAYASSRYEAVKKALEADAVSKMEVIQAKSNVETSEAAIHNAEAALSAARTNLGYCTIRAPFTGNITSSTVDVGSYINGEGAPFDLATIYDDSSVIVMFDIEASEYEKLIGAAGSNINDKIYRKVPLKFEQPLAHDHYADLNYLSPSVNQSTGTFNMKAEVKNPYGDIKPGMYVTIDLPYGNNPKAILINDASIGTDQLGKYVYVVNDSDKVVYTPIKIGGLYNDSLRVVNEGLTSRSRYVTSALLKVRDGMTVKPVLENAPTSKTNK